jgi:ribosome recycling factor
VTAVRVNQLRNIEDSIRNSDLGLNPSNDGNVIRIAILS